MKKSVVFFSLLAIAACGIGFLAFSRATLAEQKVRFASGFCQKLPPELELDPITTKKKELALDCECAEQAFRKEMTSAAFKEFLIKLETQSLSESNRAQWQDWEHIESAGKAFRATNSCFTLPRS